MIQREGFRALWNIHQKTGNLTKMHICRDLSQCIYPIYIPSGSAQKVRSIGIDSKVGTDFTYRKWNAGINNTTKHSIAAAGHVNWKGWEIAARNIADHRYELVSGYPMPGRSFLGGLEYRF